MSRTLPTLLPLLALCLPALAGMPAGLTLGETEKDVLKKAYESEDFAKLSDRAKRKLEGNYSLSTDIAGQKWIAHFVFDRRSKMLTQLLFVSDKAMQPNQYNTVLKSFYVFTMEQLREHFKLGEARNTPEFGHAGALKTEEMFPLHALPGEDIMLTTGVWKAKSGGIHLCFTLQPTTNSALGNTGTTNTSGKPADWAEVTDFTTTEEGKAFLEQKGIAIAPKPVEKETEDEPEVIDEPEPEPEPEVRMASEDLPLDEQDTLNGLILANNGKGKEGLAKLINAAQAGNARALYELGCGYSTGRYGLTPSKENADGAFRKAATAGFALAMVRFGGEFPVALAELGFREMDGNNIVKAAESANEMAPSRRFNYAIMLRYGYGVRKDVNQAITIMRELANGGDPIAAALADEWSM